MQKAQINTNLHLTKNQFYEKNLHRYIYLCKLALFACCWYNFVISLIKHFFLRFPAFSSYTRFCWQHLVKKTQSHTEVN